MVFVLSSLRFWCFGSSFMFFSPDWLVAWLIFSALVKVYDLLALNWLQSAKVPMCFADNFALVMFQGFLLFLCFSSFQGWFEPPRFLLPCLSHLVFLKLTHCVMSYPYSCFLGCEDIFIYIMFSWLKNNTQIVQSAQHNQNLQQWAKMLTGKTKIEIITSFKGKNIEFEATIAQM